MRWKLIFIIMMFSMLLIIAGCQDQNMEDECMEWSDEMLIEMRQQGITTQAGFARFKRFESHFVWEDWHWTQFQNYCGREIIFVRSEEEAAEFGHTLDVIVGWPSAYSLGILEGINNIEDIEFEIFGLAHPLTVDDFISNWEQVDNFWHEIGQERRNSISRFAEENYGVETDKNWRIRRWLFPGVLDKLNVLLENQDIATEFELALFNRRHNREITVDDLPAWPITEEDVHNDSILITSIAGYLLTDEELRSTEPENLIRAQQVAENE